VTGCGKTLLAQTLAKILDVPFCIADANPRRPRDWGVLNWRWQEADLNCRPRAYEAVVQ
jgi:MoxR-like ATPase